MTCSTRSATYAKCTVKTAVAPWEYGYGQYDKKVKDIPLRDGQTKPQTVTQLAYKLYKAKNGKAALQKEAVQYFNKLKENETVPTFFIYMKHPGLKNGKVYAEWFYDKKSRDSAFRYLEKQFKKGPDKQRLQAVKSVQYKAPRGMTQLALAKAIADGIAAARIQKILPEIPDTPDTPPDKSLPWPWIAGAAVFGTVLLLTWKR